MLVAHNGLNLAIGFEYSRTSEIETGSRDNPEVHEHKVRGKDAFVEPRSTVADRVISSKFITLCKIEKVENAEEKVYTLLASAEAVKHPNDSVSKPKGRRIALAKALKTFPRHNHNGTTNAENIALRKAIWHAYFANHKDGKTIAGVISAPPTEVGC